MRHSEYLKIINSMAVQTITLIKTRVANGWLASHMKRTIQHGVEEGPRSGCLCQVSAHVHRQTSVHVSCQLHEQCCCLCIGTCMSLGSCTSGQVHGHLLGQMSMQLHTPHIPMQLPWHLQRIHPGPSISRNQDNIRITKIGIVFEANLDDFLIIFKNKLRTIKKIGYIR